MIRLTTVLAKTRQMTRIASKQRISLSDQSSFNIHSFHDNLFSYRGLYLTKKYQFSRKKPKIDSKLQQQLDKQFNKQKKHKQKVWEKKLFQLSMMNMLPFIGFAIIFLFGKAHLAKKQSSSQQQTDQAKKGNQRKNVNIIPQLGLRQLILKGDVMDLRLQIVRKNRSRGNQQYSTFCFLKRANGQAFAAQVSLLSEFLMFIQALPHQYRISFEYEPHHQREESPILGQIINVGMIIAAFLVGKRIFHSMRNMMKNSGGQNMFDIDNKKIQAIKPQKINTLFKDVAGMHEAKFQITQFVDFLKQPEKYIEMGAKVPKGALLTGPPGTGKTLLARACAGQAGVPFYYVSGSDFVEKYVGLGASRVRKLFDEAQKNAPSIIFIDEIDAIGKKRDSGPFANEERDNTLNQLLVRMDGFDSKNKVIVMAATNIKDTLDPALLRPGRFDRSVQIGLPNFQQRKQILQVHLKKVKFDSKFTIQQLANRISILTPGFSGAQLANICNQAAILAARQGADSIDMPKFEKATQRVMAGLEKRNLFSDQEKIMLAYYECGKAVVGWFTEGSDPIIKLSILPFSKASKGYSHTIKDQIGLTTKQQLIGKVCFYLAGRATQQHFKQYVTTNGDSDLKRAKRIISLLVTKFGMSEKLKHIAFPDIQFVRKPYSSVIQITIDEEIQRITKQCIERVEALIKQKSELIQKLKVKLLQKQSLNHTDIKQILGQRPYESNQNYQKYIIEEQKAHQKVQSPVQEGEKLHENNMNEEDNNRKNVDKIKGIKGF